MDPSSLTNVAHGAGGGINVVVFFSLRLSTIGMASASIATSSRTFLTVFPACAASTVSYDDASPSTASIVSTSRECCWCGESSPISFFCEFLSSTTTTGLSPGGRHAHRARVAANLAGTRMPRRGTESPSKGNLN